MEEEEGGGGFAPQTGEACLCVHEGTWYQAKVTNINAGAAKPFHIHYHGWNKRHDRWVDAAALRPLKSVGPNDNTRNGVVEAPHPVRQKRKHDTRVDDVSATATKGPEAVPQRVSPDGDGLAVATPGLLTESDFSGVADSRTSEVCASGRLRLPSLPRELKNIIVADWDQIVNEPRHWVPLPRTPTIASVLETFLATKREQRRDQLGKWEEFVEALRTYFDVALPKVLLYRQEREQYERHKPAPGADGPLPSAVYGAEHLLRLLTRLPTLLIHSDLNSQEMPQVQTKLTDFLRFLVRHQADIFLKHYVLRETVLGGRKTRHGRGTAVVTKKHHESCGTTPQPE